MVTKRDANKQRKKRHKRVRGNISGTATKPRLCVYRSLSHITAQVIDDVAGKTLCAATTQEASFNGKGSNKAAARELGKLIGERAVKAGITDIVFDRGGYLYHGRVAELADGAREAGLKF